MRKASIFEQLKEIATSIIDNIRTYFVQSLPSAASQASTNETESGPREERHKVAGVSFRESAIRGLGFENPDFNLTKKQMIEEGLTDERVYRTDFGVYSCDLIPEPDNPEDPKAIKVMADGVHIGYIKKGSCAHIHKLLREDRIDQAVCEFGGGSYKIVLTDYDEDGDEIYTIETEKTPYWAAVVITLKD